MADSGLVWCQCYGIVREGGMCSECGFCNPEILDDENEEDAALIRAFLNDPNFDVTN